MTEGEWANTDSIRGMLDVVRPAASPRRLRLTIAAYLQYASQFTPGGTRRPAEILGDLADGLTDRVTANALMESHFETCRASPPADRLAGQHFPPHFFQRACLWSVRLPHGPELGSAVNPAVLKLLDTGRALLTFSTASGSGAEEPLNCLKRESPAHLTRCIFGNPFRPVRFVPRWRTSDVVGLAGAIYEGRAFDRMPMLADALMDAGCDSDDILSHCGGEGPHVRGCWAVDLVLGKE
jgi:hypothetical protein